MKRPWFVLLLGLLLALAAAVAGYFYVGQIKSRRALSDTRAEVDRLIAELHASEDANTDLRLQVAQCDLLSDQEQDRLARMNEEVKRIQAALDSLTGKNNELRNQVELIETQNKDLHERLAIRSEQVSGLRADLSDCGSAVQSTENRLLEAGQRIEALEETNSGLVAQNDILQSNLNELKTGNEALSAQAAADGETIGGLQARVDELIGKTWAYEFDIASLSQEGRSLQERLVAAEEKFRALEESVAGLETRNKGLEGQLSACRQAEAAAAVRLETLEGNAAAAAAQAESLLAGLREEKEGLASRAEALEQGLAERNAAVADLEGRLARLSEEKGAASVAIARLQETYDDLHREFQKELAARETTLTRLREQLSLTLVEGILFDFAKVTISAKGKETLGRIGEVLKRNEMVDIMVAGHTDDVPIAADFRRRFPSNWELSAARAAAVVRFLQDRFGIDPARMTVQGFSHYHPVAPNDTPRNRAANRRVEILIRAQNPRVSPVHHAPLGAAPGVEERKLTADD